MWDLSQNDGSSANVLMHIIIYSIVYEKKNVFVFVSVALDFTFILVSKLLVKLLKKKEKKEGCYNLAGFSYQLLPHLMALLTLTIIRSTTVRR